MYIRFYKSELHAEMMVGLNEEYEPDDEIREIMGRLAKVQAEAKVIESLIDNKNEKICPGWKEHQKKLKGD